MPAVIDDLKSVVAKVFGVNKHEVTLGSSPETIRRWDSLQHLLLVHELEKRFGVSIAMRETSKLSNVGDIVSLLESKGIRFVDQGIEYKKVS